MNKEAVVITDNNTVSNNNTVCDLSTLRQQAGYYPANEYGLLAIAGKDAAAYLQSQLSNDINKLEPGLGQFTCLLDRKAHVLAYFHLFRSESPPIATEDSAETFYVIAEKEQLSGIINHLEQFVFAAQVKFADLSDNGKFIAVEGPRCNRLLYQLGINVHLSKLPEMDTCDIQCNDHSIRIFRHTATGETGYFLWIEEINYPSLSRLIAKTADKLGFIELSAAVIETARIEAGLVKFGLDFRPDNLLPETGLEARTVSYTKGCFTGQEILARVKSHGIPAKALIGLIIDKGKSIPANSSLLVSGEEIGVLKSNAFSPTLNKLIGFAFLKRDYRVPDKKIVASIAQESITATVTIPPFITSPSRLVLAHNFYEQAVQQYIKDPDSATLTEVIELLEEALAFNLKLEDAYEALAVILGKHDRLDEAITLIKNLAQLNPDSVMAHSNLSQFYMQQGNKELAEEEKAIALSIRMKLAAAEAMAAAQKDKEAAAGAGVTPTEETKRRMSMFEQVLAIDSEDFFANAGLGECLLERREYAKAIPYLTKAIAIKANHTPSYLALATAYQESGSNEQATLLLTEGIAIATKRGDMSALQQMQDRLANASS